MKNKIMGHFVLGYPTLERSIEIAVIYQKNGIDILECQFPFSDPSADGALISDANQIGARYSNEELFDGLNSLAERINIPIVVMSYITRIHKIGLNSFFKICSTIGITEFIIPDLPFDEAIRLKILEEMNEYKCSLIPVISVNTDFERIRQMDKNNFSFYYVMSYYGTTGKTIDLTTELHEFVSKVKAFSKKNIGIGFGIKTKQQINEISRFADFSIIGSELIRQSETDLKLTTYIRSLI